MIGILTLSLLFRYIFLFDKVVIVCKRKGYNYELKEIIELQLYKMSDDPMNNRDMKKVKTAEENLGLTRWFPCTRTLSSKIRYNI